MLESNEGLNEGLMLYIVDVDRDRSIIHRIDMENGKYLLPASVCGCFEQQVNDLILLIGKSLSNGDKVQVVIDEIGYGKGFSDYLKSKFNDRNVIFKLDDKGHVVYK